MTRPQILQGKTAYSEVNQFVARYGHTRVYLTSIPDASAVVESYCNGPNFSRPCW